MITSPMINTKTGDLKRRRIMLVTARRPDPGTTCLHYGDLRPPLGLGYIATVLDRNGVEVKIVDNYLQRHDMAVEIDDFKPDAIGMYMHSPGYFVGLDQIEEIKRLTNVPLLVGGPQASLMPESIPDSVDHIVQGEGELVMLEYCRGAELPKLVSNAVTGRITNLDEQIPFPDYKFFWGKKYNWELDLYGTTSTPVFTMHTSRSCPYRCTFCGVADIWTRRYTQFSAEAILAQIDFLVATYGCKGIYFREDLFTANHKRLANICDGLIARGYDFVWAAEARADITDPLLVEKMYRSGCRGLFLGIEAGTDESLLRKKKDLDLDTIRTFFRHAKAVGLPTYATFCMGTPGETDEEIKRTIDFINEIQPTAVDRFAYLGLPKSEDYRTLETTGDYYHKDAGGIIYSQRHYDLAHELYHPDDHRLYFLRQQKAFLDENKGKMSEHELAYYRFPPMDTTKNRIVSTTHNERAALMNETGFKSGYYTPKVGGEAS